MVSFFLIFPKLQVRKWKFLARKLSLSRAELMSLPSKYLSRQLATEPAVGFNPKEIQLKSEKNIDSWSQVSMNQNLEFVRKVFSLPGMIQSKRPHSHRHTEILLSSRQMRTSEQLIWGRRYYYSTHQRVFL